ncbi:MAG: flavin reductase family protein [Pseudomonadota bacterium]
MFYKVDEPHGLARNPFKSLVAPRPIGWISSQDVEGRLNLAPYSFFNAVAADPPIVMFANNGAHSEGGAKDSVVNIESTKEFVCNLATWDTRESMNVSSAMVARDRDEFEMAGLTPIASKLVAPPRVKESPVHMECRYLQSLQLPSPDPNQPNTVVFGQVLGIHIDESILTEGYVDIAKLKPIARLGYMDYCVVEDRFTMTRPKTE